MNVEMKMMKNEVDVEARDDNDDEEDETLDDVVKSDVKEDEDGREVGWSPSCKQINQGKEGGDDDGGVKNEGEGVGMKVMDEGDEDGVDPRKNDKAKNGTKREPDPRRILPQPRLGSIGGKMGISVGGKKIGPKQAKGRGPRKKHPVVDQLNLEGGQTEIRKYFCK